uniref:Uncharacterized protein n=1 Tax=Anguilla anguilla TaxID=7936 RepID=A0A0E9X7T6_ANGAN
MRTGHSAHLYTVLPVPHIHTQVSSKAMLWIKSKALFLFLKAACLCIRQVSNSSLLVFGVFTASVNNLSQILAEESTHLFPKTLFDS